MHAVSLTPHAWCMMCHRHRMHQKNFWTTLKSENHMQNSDGMSPRARYMRCHWHCMHVCMRYQWHRMHGACGINDTAKKYDTACTIDERFERPWQPLKGTSIKNIYSWIVLPVQIRCFLDTWSSRQWYNSSFLCWYLFQRNILAVI
jgi:hypothetical protein